MDFFAKGDFNIENYFKKLYGSVENLITQAKNGDVSAQIYLGVAYGKGLGDFVEQDSERAIGWLNTAVENGCALPSVLEKLGELLDLKGEPHNQRKAYQMYHRAAQMGSNSAQLNLAEMYRCGVEGVVNEDIKEAFEWYKKAAGESAVDYSTELGALGPLIAATGNKLGNAVDDFRQKALTSLYKYYLVGDCPEGRPQPTKAVYYLTRAAELGDTGAQRELGRVYLTGSCEQIKDLKKAKRWLEKASTSGDEMARQLLQLCRENKDKMHEVSEVSEEAVNQSFDIVHERFKMRANKHPFAVLQPVAFSEKMLQQFDRSPTARIYLRAYKLVKEGLEVLFKSNFTDERGITLIAHGYLTENSILQAFPQMLTSLLPNIFKLCEETLFKNPCFFEGLLLSFALRSFNLGQGSEKSANDCKVLMCIINLINLIKRSEPNSLPLKDPYQFDKNYSSWLHVLYYFLAAIYSIQNSHHQAAESFANSLECCPSYFDAKRGLGFSLIQQYKQCFNVQDNTLNINELIELLPGTVQFVFTPKEELRDKAVKVLKEYLEEAPPCDKSYPNVYYYLAQVALLEENMKEFRTNYELGQDAEENRLPFFDAVNLPLKDSMTPYYQLYANVRQPARCGNRACTREVKEIELKLCGKCRKKKYCSKDCQTADWKNHKVACTASEDPKPRSKHT